VEPVLRELSPRFAPLYADSGRGISRAGLDWRFTIVDAPEINAFALPGGYVYGTRG
jgi:predicted Zn-dependent protease